jgi:signal transduction histidine kinase/DNA-binding NarL/FixJ family response regulator
MPLLPRPSPTVETQHRAGSLAGIPWLRCVVWTALLLALLPGWAQAVPVSLGLASPPDRLPVAPACEILEDPGRQLTIETARRADGWRPVRDRALAFGISRAAWWVRLAVRNDAAHPLDLVLDTGSTQQDYLDWYLAQADGELLAKGRLGDRYPTEDRSLATRTLALPLHLAPGQTLDLYLRCDTHDGLYDMLPLTLSGTEAFSRQVQGTDLVLTLFHGGLLVLFSLSLCLLACIRDSRLLYYTLYLLSFLSYSCVASGFDLLYLWPQRTRLHNALALSSGILAIVFGNAFAMAMLDLARQVPAWLWRTLQGLVVLTLLGLVPIARDHYTLGFAWTFVGLILTLCMFGLSLRLAVRDVRGARYICAGFVVLIAGLSANHFQLIGIINNPNINLGSIQVGAFFQIMIYAFALALSLSRLEAEKMQAEAADRAKAAFLATMSHEIRTPLHAILGFAHLGLAQERNLRQRGRLERIARAGRHLLGIINDILDFTKIDGGYLILEHVPFAPRSLLSDIRDMLGAKAAAKGLCLDIEAGDDLPELVSGDPLRIRQILLNFVTNAIKFSDTGTIQVRLRPTRRNDGALGLHGEVEDTGIGVDPAQAKQLFTPFTQADASISRRFGGTGLGLAISKSLAERMGGAVGLASTPGKGSRFWFQVPVEAADPASQTSSLFPSPAEEPVWERLEGRRVLLVDDNELNRLVSRELLETVGLAVETAEDGAQAIERLTQAPDGTYDLVLMDMMMPVLDGLAATRRLRANPRFAGLPVIAMTANAGIEEARRCAQAGLNAHLAKPIDEMTLWHTLARFLPPSTPPATARPAETRLFDPGALQELRDLTTPERFGALIGRLVHDCEAQGRRIGELARSGDSQALRREVHDLISTAGNAGLEHLLALCQALRQALHDGDRTGACGLAEQIERASRESTRLVREHFRIARTGNPAGAGSGQP